MNCRILIGPVVTGCVAALVSGCGGGGTKMDDDPMLTVPAGLSRSAVPAVYVDANVDLDTQFPALSANLRRDRANSVSELTADAYIKSVSGNPSAQFLSITYVVGGVEETVDFTSADVTEIVTGFVVFEKPNGPWAGVDISLEHFNRIATGGYGQDRLYATAGFRTDAASMPSGTAEYSGFWYGDSYLSTDPGNPHRIDYAGDVSLMADFDEDALSGMSGSVNEIRTRSRDASGNRLPWEDLPDTTQFMIHDGLIEDGQFEASLTGMDSNANAPMDMTVNGYKGGILGEFYGPNAEEVGGVWNATRDRDDRVMGGNFQAQKDEQQ